MNSPKYPRTFHMPWSKGATNDDKIATDLSNLIGQPIVITEKIDGSNTSLEAHGCFARTHAGPPAHASFDGLKALHASLKYKIPHNLQFFGEWCFALHSIAYSELPGYFLLFNVRELGQNSYEWASWEEVEMWAEEITVPTVPVLFKGILSKTNELQELVESLMIQPSLCGGIREGVVARVQRKFSDNEFSTCVLKCVRKDHVTTSAHWAHQTIVKNSLKLE